MQRRSELLITSHCCALLTKSSTPRFVRVLCVLSGYQLAFMEKGTSTRQHRGRVVKIFGTEMLDNKLSRMLYGNWVIMIEIDGQQVYYEYR
jgi:hypothetical protein